MYTMNNGVKYNAFISYKHAPLDMAVAKRIHKGLETFKVPGSVKRKTGRKKIERIFRDQEELPIGSDLGNNITAALSASEFLIVICSPETPKSYWVQKEIETFISMHGRAHILAVLVDGEPEDSFPQLLLTDDKGNPVEPLAADVRGADDKERFKKLKTELLRLAAPLLGCTYDELRQRHRERRIRKITGAALVVAVCSVLFGMYSFYNASLIAENLKEKQINQSKYLANKSLELLEYGDRKAAALVALEALPSEEEDRPYVALAQLALGKALGSYETGNKVTKDGILSHSLTVRDMMFNKVGDKLLTTTGAGTVYGWNLTDNTQMFTILPAEDNGYMCSPEYACFNADENAVIVNKLGIFVYDENGIEIKHMEAPEDAYISEAEHHEESNLLVIQSAKALYLYDMSSWERLSVIENPTEINFSLEMCFSKDGTKLAVSHSEGMEEKGGMFSVYDIEADRLETYPCKADYVMELCFAEGDTIAVASGDTTGDALYGLNEDMDSFLEMISLEDGSVKWEKSYGVDLYGTDSSTLHLFSREYESNGKHRELILGVNDVVTTYDMDNGETISETYMNSGIVELRVALNDVYGYVSCGDENIYVVDLTTGMNYTASAIVTGREVAGFHIRNSTVIVRSYLSPDILVMKYHMGEGCEKVTEFEQSIYGAKVTSDGSIYVVEESAGLSARNLHFYDASTGEKLGVTATTEDKSFDCGFFSPDNYYVTCYRDGSVDFIEAATGECETSYITQEEFTLGKYYITKNYQFILFTDGNSYFVFDVNAREVTMKGELAYYIHGMILSEDGKKLYGNIKDLGVVCVDASSSVVSRLNIDGAEVYAGSDCANKFALDRDGKQLAVACKDNVLRVIDTENIEVLSEIPFAGGYRCFISFDETGKYLIMQGDDYYINVYSLEKKDYAYIPMTQNNQITSYMYDGISDFHVIQTSGELIFMTGADFMPVFEQSDVICYIVSSKELLTGKYKTLYKHPYKDLEMLREEAMEQFGDANLTREQRIRYNVD